MRQAFAVWITGLPASGKSTIARALIDQLRVRGIDAAVLESDALRTWLTPDATYSPTERDTFYNAMVHIGALLVQHGVPVIFDATAVRRLYRDAARTSIDRFAEVYVDCPAEVCVARDPKGIYLEARTGKASTVPGLQVTYEVPERPDLTVSGTADPVESARAIVDLLVARAFIGRREATHGEAA